LKSSGGAAPLTAGQGFTPGGHVTVQTSVPGTALPLNAPVPSFRSTSWNGTAWIGWQFVMSCEKHPSVAWRPPKHGPQLPFSSHFCVPSKQPGLLWYEGSPLKHECA
jgi:hypothetical protein